MLAHFGRIGQNQALIQILIVEDNHKLRTALHAGLKDTGQISVAHDCDSGEAALEYCLHSVPDAILMDVQLAGTLNGIQAAVEIRREFPRLPGSMMICKRARFNRNQNFRSPESG